MTGPQGTTTIFRPVFRPFSPNSWRPVSALLRFIFLLFALCAAVPAAAGPRLDAIRSRDALICALSATETGMGKREADGNFSGFEADFCRAVSVTIFGTPKVRFLAIDTLDAFLNSDADMAIRRLTWTFAREAGRLRFGPIVLHDGQTFLVKEIGGISKIEDLSRKRICTSLDAAFTANLKRAFGERKLSLNMLNSAARTDAEKAFFAGDCEALSADATELASALNARPDIASRYRILPERISKEPLSPVLRRGDEELFDAVRWTFFALVTAEELRVTRQTTLGKTEGPLRDFLGAPAPPGFAQRWTEKLVRNFGHYGAIYDRHLGRNAPARLARGQNALARDGGLLFAPPFK